jgi:hypothetical protein
VRRSTRECIQLICSMNVPAIWEPAVAGTGRSPNGSASLGIVGARVRSPVTEVWTETAKDSVAVNTAINQTSGVSTTRCVGAFGDGYARSDPDSSCGVAITRHPIERPQHSRSGGALRFGILRT